MKEKRRLKIIPLGGLGEIGKNMVLFEYAGDIVVVGKNFGCGSSRQQAVDCFKSLGISVIIAESFGAIYERNAINNAMPILIAENITNKVIDKDEITVDFVTGKIFDKAQNKEFIGKAFSKSQIEIYKKGGLLS